MALDTRRHRRKDFPDANISNKTLPGFAVMGIGLVILVIGAILFPALGSPTNVSEKPATIVGPVLTGLGFVVIIIGIGLSIWLKKKKPKVSHDDQGADAYGYGQPSTVGNANPNYGNELYPSLSPASTVPMYGPPAPMATRAP